jgi:hypothetical protein
MSETSSTVSRTSEVMPDVTFVVRRMSFGLRSKIRKRLSKVLGMIRDKSDEIEVLVERHNIDQSAEQVIRTEEETGIVALPDEGAEAAVATPVRSGKFTPEQIRVIDKISDISHEIEIINQCESDPVYLEECFVSIQGYQVDGAVPNWKSLLDKGDEELCQEIIRAIKEEAGLTAKVSENLKSPITSGAVADGQTSDTIAPNASETAGGEGATVVSISQST